MRQQRRALILVCGVGFFLLGPPLRSVPLSIMVQASRSAPVSVHVRALNASTGLSAGEWAIEVSSRPEYLDLSVPESAQWRVEVSAPGYWSAGAAVSSAAGANVTLVPTTNVVGKISDPPRTQTSHLTVAFQPGRASDRKKVDAFPHELPCVVDGGNWACPLPVGTWDLRFALPGYAPVYRWEQRITDERLDLGAMAFRAGASVSGWVLNSNTSGRLAALEPPTLVSIAIPLVRVRGVLTFEGSGVGGAIFFGGSRGIESIRIEADPEGRFEGALPHPGRWLLEVELSAGNLVALEDVEVPDPHGEKPVRLDIELPATRVRGRVVENGRATRALIVATRDDGKGSLGGRAFSGETKVDGTWELMAIPPGRVTLYAHAEGSESDRVTLEIAEDVEPSELVLELHRKGKIRAWLTDGVNAVAGGLISTRPSAGLGRRLTSAIDGSFWIEFSPDSSRVDMVVVPPSAGASLRTVSTPTGSEPVIVVEPAAGSLIVPSLDGWLAWRGVVVPMALVFSAFDAAGRFDVVQGQGYRLSGLAAGSWTWCPQREGSCKSGELNGSGDVVIAGPQRKSGS